MKMQEHLNTPEAGAVAVLSSKFLPAGLGAPAGVHLWFGLVCIALGTAAALLPAEPRLVLAVAAAGIELYWVVHNLRLGIKVF